MKKVLKYLYGVGFIILFLWGIWAFLPYLCFLTGMTADEDHAIRNILAGYELPVFIIILMGLITLAKFFTSYVNDFSEESMENIDCVRISLADLLSDESFWEKKDGQKYISCQALADARACAEEFLRLTEGWTITDEDHSNGFARFEGKIRN